MSVIKEYSKHPITEAQFSVLRGWLRERLEHAVAMSAGKPLTVCLSGGIDSTTLLFACLEAEIDVRAVTFYCEHYPSNDLIAARQLCRIFNVPHLEVPIPIARLRVLEDVERVIDSVHWEKTDKVRKSTIQCVYPFLYLCPAVQQWQSDPHPILLNNFAVGPVFFTTRKDGKDLSAYGEEKMGPTRNSTSEDPRFSTFHIQQLGRDFGCTMFDPLDDPFFYTWVQQFPISLTNLPVQKYALVGMYRRFWKIGSFYRTAESFQIVSGIREAHDQLLTLPQYRKHQAVIAVYNEIAKSRGVLSKIGTKEPKRDENNTMLLSDGTRYGCPNEASYKELADRLEKALEKDVYATTHEAA